MFNKQVFFQAFRLIAPSFLTLALAVHQLGVRPFIEPRLYTWLYLLCFLILTLNSLSLFFLDFSKAKKPGLFTVLTDALFFSLIPSLLLSLGVFFVFFFSSLYSLVLFLFDKKKLSFYFFSFLAFFLPWSFYFGDKIMPKGDRLAFSLLCLFFFAFTYLLLLFIDRFFKSYFQGLFRFQKPSYNFLSFEELSLNFAKKLLPTLQSVEKNLEKKEAGKIKDFVSYFLNIREMRGEDLKFEVVDVKKLVEEVLDKVKGEAPKNLETHFQFQEGLKLKVSLKHMKKCFEEILRNSFDSLKQTGSPKIDIRGFVRDHRLILKFADSGHGIDLEDQKRIFEPFFTRRFGLRGLGLTYVLKVLNLHQATFRLFSGEGQGTLFELSFPLEVKTGTSSFKEEKKSA